MPKHFLEQPKTIIKKLKELHYELAPQAWQYISFLLLLKGHDFLFETLYFFAPYNNSEKAVIKTNAT